MTTKKRITISLTETRYQKLLDLCEAKNCSKSEIITELINVNWLSWVITLPGEKQK